MTDPDHPEIYRSQAEQYEALVSREDYQGNILRAIQAILPVDGIDVVELGAGTGRLTCLLAPLVQSIRAFDISPHMLEVAREQLKKCGRNNWSTAVADHRRVDAADNSADLVISGWSVCYVVVDNPETWRAELGKVLAEMRRILRPGGMILLLETLGTGFEQPTPPAHLLEYYAWLEEQGFQRSWIRTDYRFESRQKAEELARFFFGEEMVAKVQPDAAGATLAECTGLWRLKP